MRGGRRERKINACDSSSVPYFNIMGRPSGYVIRPSGLGTIHIEVADSSRDLFSNLSSNDLTYKVVERLENFVAHLSPVTGGSVHSSSG